MLGHSLCSVISLQKLSFCEEAASSIQTLRYLLKTCNKSLFALSDWAAFCPRLLRPALWEKWTLHPPRRRYNKAHKETCLWAMGHPAMGPWAPGNQECRGQCQSVGEVTPANQHVYICIHTQQSASLWLYKTWHRPSPCKNYRAIHEKQFVERQPELLSLSVIETCNWAPTLHTKHLNMSQLGLHLKTWAKTPSARNVNNINIKPSPSLLQLSKEPVQTLVWFMRQFLLHCHAVSSHHWGFLHVRWI